jgi:DNA polymerase-3 subunit alpha
MEHSQMSKYFEYPCGCRFEIVGEKNGSPLLKFNTDIKDIPLNCSRTWQILGDGNTKGVFQLESQLGQSKAKDLKPINIEHLSALTAILRPGCLQSKLDGKTITDKYIDRKNGIEPTDVFHPALKDILESTYQVLIYQESIMQAAQKVAGFTLLEADALRKGIAKKKTDIISKLKAEFIDKSIELDIITKEDAEQIFSWIEKSARYSFNKCISPNTIVNTKDGPKTIDELDVGEQIDTPEGYSEVLDKIESGIKRVYEITTEDGKTMICTLDHEFLCSDNIKRKLSEIIEYNLEIIVQ